MRHHGPLQACAGPFHTWPTIDCRLTRHRHALLSRPQSLKLSAEPLTESILRIKLTDADSKRWEVPTWLFRSSLLPGGGGGPDRTSQPAGKPAAGAQKAGSSAGPVQPAAPASSRSSSRNRSASSQQNSQQFHLELREAPFGIEVSRHGGSGATVFNTSGTRLVYKASSWRLGLGGGTDEVVADFATLRDRQAQVAGHQLVCSVCSVLHTFRASCHSPLAPAASAPSCPAGPVLGTELLGGPFHPAVWSRRARLAHPPPRVRPVLSRRRSGCAGGVHARRQRVPHDRAWDGWHFMLSAYPTFAGEMACRARCGITTLDPPFWSRWAMRLA